MKLNSSASAFMLLVCKLATLSTASIFCSERARFDFHQFRADPATYTLDTTTHLLLNSSKVELALAVPYKRGPVSSLAFHLSVENRTDCIPRAILTDGRCKIRIGLYQELSAAYVDAVKDVIKDARTPAGSSNYWFHHHWTFVTRLDHENFPRKEFYNTCELTPSGCDVRATFYHLSVLVDDCYGSLTIEFPRYTTATQL